MNAAARKNRYKIVSEAEWSGTLGMREVCLWVIAAG